MTSYEFERALVYIAEQIIKTFGKDFGFEIQEPKQEPVEPLIKDEKIRKAVRAWAEACRLKYAIYKQSSNEFYDPDTRGKFAIKFTLKPIEVWLDDGKCYTITELCGEEEE